MASSVSTRSPWSTRKGLDGGGWRFHPGLVRGHVPELLADPDKLSRYGANAWKYGIRDAAEVMAKRVLALIDQPAD